MATTSLFPTEAPRTEQRPNPRPGTSGRLFSEAGTSPAGTFATIFVSRVFVSTSVNQLAVGFEQIVAGVEAAVGQLVRGGSTPQAESQATGSQVAELRRLSGLTWEQLAGLFDVTPRAVHFWVSGRRMSEEHEARLREALAIVRAGYKGGARATRQALLTAGAAGRTPLELLTSRAYAEARAALGPGVPQRERPKPSAELLEARRPPPPHELISEPEPEGLSRGGKLLGSWPIKTKRSK